VSDPRERDATEAKRKQLVLEFLRHSTEEVERMRALVPRLAAGDDAAWSQVTTLAHNIAVGAVAQKLGVLVACARELETLTAEREPGPAPGEFLMQCVTSAIEAVALEMTELRRA
jgi:hypothetical protein